MKRFLVILPILIILSSCVTVKKLNNLSKVYVTNTKQINLLPPESINIQIDDTMMLTGNFGETSFSILTYVQADEAGLYFSLMNDFGTDMGTISYDGYDAYAQAAILPEKLKIEYIINDFQNAFYKVEDIRKNLQASKLDLEVTTEDDGKKEIRRVVDGKKVIEEVIITQEGALIKNLLRNYSFSLYFFQ